MLSTESSFRFRRQVALIRPEMDKKKNNSADSQPQVRIKRLLQDLEKEFDSLLNENLQLQEQLNRYVNNSESGATQAAAIERPSTTTADCEISEGKKLKSKLTASGTKHKIKAQTSRIVSSFKTPSIVSSLVRDFAGCHTDGVWEVTASLTQPLIATASADHAACIWSIDTGKCLLKYEGHSGSVNSIRFHPSKDLLLTASGDNSAHIWLGAVNWEKVAASSRTRGHSSEEELEDEQVDDLFSDGERERIETLRTPLQEFSNNGHNSVVVAADWISSNDAPTQIITASWDRTAILWDIETKSPIQTLTGHDSELTHCCAHQNHRLVVTSSRDSTFRLWDFRTEIPAVSVFQGHSESVTSTIFSKDDKVISGSDDKSVKIWELRNMRAPLTTIRTDSPVNRLAVSSSGVIAIPHDNRSIRLFDLNGQRIARLQRTSRLGHRRMVSSVAWKENSPMCNLFSSGFDKKVFGWHISI